MIIYSTLSSPMVLVLPNNKNMLLIESLSGHPIFQWCFFFQWHTGEKEEFRWWFIKCKSKPCWHFKSKEKKTFISKTKCSDASWSCVEVFWSETIILCKKIHYLLYYYLTPRQTNLIMLRKLNVLLLNTSVYHQKPWWFILFCL